jgi:16S rRNA (guanine1516-N2)-methyltransferase
MQTMPSIAILTPADELQHKASALSQRLNLPLTNNQADFDYILILTPDYLGLQKTQSKSKPLYIDFLSPQMQIRRKQASLRKEMLARALGLKNKSPRNIIDTTTGLGRDSFILACLGFEVTSLERSPIIAALLEDAIERASIDPEVGPIVGRIRLINENAIEWLNNYLAKNLLDASIIYLDPMFPERKKSALSKHDMRIFHEVIGSDLDADALLKAALTCATDRVVVKRPRLAPPIAEIPPTFSMEGSSNRFDIYLTRETHGHNTSAT